MPATATQTTRLLSTLAVATLALPILFCAPHADAKGKPGGGGGGGGAKTNFAFVFEDADKGLFLTPIDDANRVQLTRTKGRADHIEPRWSPDLDPETEGYQGVIAYVELVPFEYLDLRVVNPDGSGDRLLAADVAGAGLAWTPNGKEIVLQQIGRRIIAVEVATGNLRILWESGSTMHYIAISPWGQLAFDQDGDVWLVDYSFNADGLIELDPTTITSATDPDTYESVPSFSPDGTYLAYVHDEYNGNNFRIVVQDLLTGDEMVVMEELNGWDHGVTWSPDGSQLATYNRIDGSHTQELVRIADWADPIQRQIIRVTSTDRNTHEITPDWFPYWEDL